MQLMKVSESIINGRSMMAKVARQAKTTIQKLLLEGTATDVLQNSCSKEFCKVHRKTSSSRSLLNKGAG